MIYLLDYLSIWFKDRRLWFGAILQYSHSTFVIFFTSEGIHMYYILIERQIRRLSNGISNIKMGKRMLLKINQKN